MKYTDFLRLEWKSFLRAPNFSKKLALKILAIIGYLFLSLYMVGLAFIAFFVFKEKYPDADPFIKANEHIYIFFFIIIYLLMYVSFNSLKVKPYMLLPIAKKKIVNYHIFRNLLSPVNLILTISVLVYAAILLTHHYQIWGVISWLISVISTLIFINLALIFAEKSPIIGGFMSIFLILLIVKIKVITPYLAPLGDFFYETYTNPFFALIPIATTLLLYKTIYRFVYNRFYLDDALKNGKKSKVSKLELNWTNRFGIIGGFIKNDIRMIWRNKRPKQSLLSIGIIYIFGFLIYGTSLYSHNEFMKVLWAIMLTGAYIINFGSYIPAWDSEHYRLLMSQSLNYRQYLDAKWWLMTFSVMILGILSLPFIYFGKDIFLMIMAMAVFNIGLNIHLVLLTGLFTTTPIKLNQKVKAFDNTANFNMKIMMLSMLRIGIPIAIYFLVLKFFGLYYAFGIMAVMGILGLIFKNLFLDFLSGLYIKRKYKTIHAFSKNESE